MTQAVEEDCPICNSSRSAKEQFATIKLAEHVRDKARRDDAHQQWIDEHTETGSLGEIRKALNDHDGPRP